MDLKNLYSTIHWLEYSSFTFNAEYYVLLTNSVLILQNDNHFKRVFFWGIVQGTETDYYVVFGYKTDAINDRKFYYSEDCQNWKLLPVPQHEHLVLTELCRKPFIGDPSFVIEIVDNVPREDLFEKEPFEETERENVKETYVEKPVDQEIKEESKNSIENNKYDERKSNLEIENKGNKPKYGSLEPGSKSEAGKESGKGSEPEVIQDEIREELPQITSGELKEEDRLAAIIYIISEETSLVPRGGLFKQTDGVTTHSRAFEGLQMEDADELCSFQHYRKPRQDWNSNLMTRTDYNYAIDFLDTIDKDLPSDCWIAQLVEGDRCIILRNLQWPGFSFFHHLTTPDHGFMYIGAGLRNLDIPFMSRVFMSLVEEKKSNKQSSLKSTKTSVDKSNDGYRESVWESKNVDKEPLNEASDEEIIQT